MGTLYIVSTPIGNLQDLSLRAAKTLFMVSFIACEDTRRTGLLLQHITEFFHAPPEQKAKLISYFEQNELERIPFIISLLKDEKDVALVSDAGTPAISDPGFRLIRACVQEGIPVTAVPGPSSILAALVISGLPTDKFTFIGYLPHKESHARKILENTLQSLKLIKSTIILFEAPHKLIKTLERMQEILGDRDIVLCRELTKIHEEVIRGKISTCSQIFTHKIPKGEFVILFQ